MNYQWPAYLYDGKSAGRTRVKVKMTVPGYIVVEHFSSVARYKFADISISERIGSQPARVRLPDGSQLEIADAEEFYRSLEAAKGSKDWLHRLESRWSWVLLALVAAGFLGWVTYARGIPILARQIAYALPRDIDRSIGAEGLELLDAGYFQASQLSSSRRDSLRDHFANVVDAVGGDGSYQLEFRKGGQLGPNAFALPSGIVVLTDELAQIAENDLELAAVLAHEVGHVRNRHTIRALLQNSVVAGGIILVTGDASFVNRIVAGIPSLLANAAYSREFESEADTVAREYMLIQGIPLHYFADILLRLETVLGGRRAGTSLLSTHPGSRERAANFVGVTGPVNYE